MIARFSNRQAGTTLIEMLVACFIATVFIMAAGTGYLVNQKAYRANIEKLELQQTASHVMEIMERKIREAASVKILDPQKIELYDGPNCTGNVTTRFRLNQFGSDDKLYEGGVVLAKQELVDLEFIPNPDTTCVRIVLNLKDHQKNEVIIEASAVLRNHPKLRNMPDS